MKAFISLLLLLLFLGYQSDAQRPDPDEFPTQNGPLTIQPVQHGTLVLSWNGKTLYVDPFGGAEAFEGLNAPDMILITDIHGDHLNLETLKAIDTKAAVLVVPEAVAEKLPGSMGKEIVTLKNDEQTDQMEISIKAIPMYNLPESSDSRHPKGRGNGYVLSMGGKNVYISGDTEDIPEMRSLKNIDVAFVCMNLPYTMDINRAASAVLEFKPAIIYPYHYRGQDTEAFKKLVNEQNADIDVRLKDWYPNN